ncbi:MAG: Zn-ribbon domain-containing OB-fold protein [Chitinivibrionia bacterium]|nr:Zn-ribbon domain-containing OB-fold protein [Chitinivibrionia bacterium]
MLTPPKYWREIPQRYRLEAAKCAQCGKVFFPPRLICDACKGEEFETVVLPREGKIVSFTEVHTPASNFSDEAPFAVGIIDLGNELTILAQIVDCDPGEVKIGAPMRLEFRKLQKDGESGVLCYGYKAVPAR